MTHVHETTQFFLNIYIYNRSIFIVLTKQRKFSTLSWVFRKNVIVYIVAYFKWFLHREWIPLIHFF